MKKTKRKKQEKAQLSPEERRIRREFLGTLDGREYRISEKQIELWIHTSNPTASRVFRNMLRQDRKPRKNTSELEAA